MPDLKKPAVLLVDDEERILRSLSMLFRGQYRVMATTDANEALDIVTREQVHVIVSDQKMPIMRGADLLREVRDRSPNTMRILLTGYSELDAVIASVNEGEIFRYINKPWDSAELRSTVGQAAQVASALFAAPSAAIFRAPAPARPVVPAGSAANGGLPDLDAPSAPFPVPVAAAVPAYIAAAPAVAPVAAAGAHEMAGVAEGSSDDCILVIDDDPEVFKTMQDIAGPNLPVVWAQSIEQAFAHLERYPVGVIVSDLVVKRESLTAMLKVLKAQHPEVVTIVCTPFEDTGVLVNLINQGQVFRLLPKPVRRGPLGMNVASALRQHRLLKSSPLLRSRVAVEKIKQPEEASIASRFMGFLGRLRSRALA